MSTTVTCQSQSCPNGNPPSRLECPTCSKLGIRGSFFCGQECFKSGCKYELRFLCHVLPINPGNSREGTYNPFVNYSFTGTLRPVYPLSPKRVVPDHIPRPEYAQDGAVFRKRQMSIIGLTYTTRHSQKRDEGCRPTSQNTDQGRAGKNEDCMQGNSQEESRLPLSKRHLKIALCLSKLGREVLDITAAAIRPGVTTDELDEIAHNACIERNAYPSPLNYRNFPKSICTSVNEVICHGIPDKRKLREGDIINLDISVYYDGFHADLNETYPVGKIDEDSEKLIRTTRESLDAAIKICKPGALFRDIGKAIEPIARANGCAVVRTFTGHGVNTLFHCPPNIPHYAKNKAVGTMKPGMTFTIEPMLNLGNSWSDVHWPDNWTATTADGRRSAQFEDTLLITETGVEILTASNVKV
ncbi:hypothetical protein CVT24_007498 [Panaeolus cyanescens]|uniref:Methionine aminopeptidase n=1 Tax=Panaeolus cyanescens TaxID=181874 RepID=A0A409YL69_9AGAR|nr:hypothetical protein CVT24_007498 [Panaeolus cyanescens]